MNNLIQKVLTCFVALALLFGFVSVPVQADNDWVTAELDGTTSCNCSKDPRGSASGSATAYADIMDAVGRVQISVGYGWSNNCSKSSGSGSVSATFNGNTYYPSGYTITFDVGDTPVSGTITINMSCSVYNGCDSRDVVSASASVSSVKYHKAPKPKFNSNSPK